MLQPIILAAGKGTRMQTEKPKALFPIQGKPMIDWLLDTLAQVPSTKSPLIVIGHGGEHIRAHLGDRYTYVMQTELTGPATAVKTCIPIFLTQADPALILYGDNPFITKESIERAEALFTATNATLIFGSVTVPHFENEYASYLRFGRVTRDAAGDVERIVEYKNADDAERAITEVNSGMYCVDPAWLASALQQIQPNPVSGEYYLTDIVELARGEGRRIVTASLAPREGLGINSIEDAVCAQFLL